LNEPPKTAFAKLDRGTAPRRDATLPARAERDGAPDVARSGTTDGTIGGPRQRPLTLDFEAVYAEHFQFVWRSLRLLGVSTASLDDAAQDVFGAIARQLPDFEGRSSLRTWVFGITQNVASNHRRTRSRKLDRLEPLDDGIESREPTPHAHAEGREAAELVVRFCAELDESRRTVFVLGVLEGVPAAEIASLLGIALNTVYTRIHSLRHALKARIERREVET
jgi:RNA polymerase sigma-70 factor (ECF subfamily)